MALGFFVFSLLWGGFALTWSYLAWSKGSFTYVQAARDSCDADSQPWPYWCFVIGAALAGLIVIALGMRSVVRSYRASPFISGRSGSQVREKWNLYPEWDPYNSKPVSSRKI